MDTSLSAELSAFRDFCRHEGQAIVEAITNEGMPCWSGCPPEQLGNFTRQVYERATEQLFQRWPHRSRAEAHATYTKTQHQALSLISDAIAVGHQLLPPTPPSVQMHDVNEMMSGYMKDELPMFAVGQQFEEVGMRWMSEDVQTQAQQETWSQTQQEHVQQHEQQQGQGPMYFEEVPDMDVGGVLSAGQQQQCWIHSDILDSMGGWSW
jgi:hypothetical protein